MVCSIFGWLASDWLRPPRRVLFELMPRSVASPSVVSPARLWCVLGPGASAWPSLSCVVDRRRRWLARSLLGVASSGSGRPRLVKGAAWWAAPFTPGWGGWWLCGVAGGCFGVAGLVGGCGLSGPGCACCSMRRFSGVGDGRGGERRMVRTLVSLCGGWCGGARCRVMGWVPEGRGATLGCFGWMRGWGRTGPVGRWPAGKAGD